MHKSSSHALAAMAPGNRAIDSMLVVEGFSHSGPEALNASSLGGVVWVRPRTDNLLSIGTH